MIEGLWGVALSNGLGFALFVYLFLESRKDYREQTKYAKEREDTIRRDSNEREERYQDIVCGLTEALQTNKEICACLLELRNSLRDNQTEVRGALSDLFKLVRKEI